MDNIQPIPLQLHPPYDSLQHGHGGSWYSPLGASVNRAPHPQGLSFFDFSYPQALACESHGNSASLSQFQGNMMAPQDTFFEEEEDTW